MPGTQPVGGDSPGRVLRSAREALGLSRREIAEALNLLESTVVAIEDDDRARQPEPVFLRGYVRNYAKLLRLDPEPLVAALNSERRPAVTPVKVPKPLTSNPWLWPVAGALVASLLLIATVLYLLKTPPQNTGAVDVETAAEETLAEAARWDSSRDSNVEATPLATGNDISPLGADSVPDSATAPAAEASVLVEIEPDGADAPQAGVPVEAVQSENFGDVASTGRETSLQALDLDVEAVGFLPADVDPVVDTFGVTAQAESVTTIKPRRLNRGTDSIRLDFSADCWVRVKDTSGKMLFSDMGRAGGAMELLGTGPFDLLLGNAPGTTLKWNGEPIALQPHMRNNVATLKLGETPVAQADERPAQ